MTLWALCKKEFSSPLFPANMLILSVQRNGSIFHSASRQKESIKLHEFLESKYSRCSLINKHLSISFATTIHSAEKLERYRNFLLTKKTAKDDRIKVKKNSIFHSFPITRSNLTWILLDNNKHPSIFTG